MVKNAKAIAAEIAETIATDSSSTKGKVKKVVKTLTASDKAAMMAIKAIKKLTGQDPITLDKKPIPCIPTGSLALNNLIGGNLASDKSGPICPGYPRKHITEIYGPEASGKTTLTLEAIAQVQQAGGKAMFLDYEHALNHGYAIDVGVDFDALILFQPNTLEEGLEMVRVAIVAGIDLVVVDSVAAMIPQADADKKFSDADKIGARAAALSAKLPRLQKLLKTPSANNPLGTALILINQPRATIDASGGGESTSGGKALKFYAYLRLQIRSWGEEKIEKADPISKVMKKMAYGTKSTVKVIKSKINAKTGQTADIFIRYGQGIDDYYTTMTCAQAYKIMKKEGSYYEYDGTRIQGREKFRNFLVQNDAVYDKMQAEVMKIIRGESEGLISTEEEESDDELSSIISVVSDDVDESFDPPEEEIITEEV